MKYFLILFFIVLGPIRAFTQIDSTRSASLLKVRLEGLIDRYRSGLNRPALIANDDDVSALFTAAYTDSLAYVQSESTEANARFLKADKGLRAAASYTENLSGGFEDLGFFYRSSFNLGADWNVISGGYLENRMAARQLTEQDKLARALSTGIQEGQEQIVRNQIDATFDKAIEIKKRYFLQFIKENENIARDLFLNRYILWEDLLKLRTSARDLRLAIGEASEAQFSKRPRTLIDSLPLYQIDEQALLRTLSNRVKEDSLLQINTLVNQYKLPYLREVALRPYVRYNFYTYDINNRKRDFLSAGFLVSAPLNPRFKNRAELAETSQKELVARVHYVQKNNAWLAGQLLLNYRAKLSEWSAAFHESLMMEELLRKEIVKRDHHDPEYSEMIGLGLLKSWFENDLLQAGIKKEAFRILGQISILTQQPLPATYTKVYLPELSDFQPARARDKSVYIWSHSFANAEIKNLTDELEKGGFRRVILSIAHQDSLKLKALDFITSLSAKGIKLDLMIANNNLIYPNHVKELVEEIHYIKSVPGISGIHLDIEPHVLPEWDNDKPEMYRSYVKMIETVAAELSDTDLDLSVSIPVHYDIESIQRIQRHVERIYLMAYEHPDVSYVIRKTSEEVSLFKSKVTIALSATDFPSVSALEAFMEELTKAGGFSSFAIHDYKRLQNLKK